MFLAIQTAPARGWEGESGESRTSRLAGLESLVAELYQRSGAAQFDLPVSQFSEILNEIAGKYVAPEEGQPAVRELLAKLHVQDLALARACAAGQSRAWELLLIRYRECLYQTASAITKDDTSGRELADTLYADLYGSDSRTGRRVSKLNSYTGVGSLSAWLGTVLAQAHINRYRRERRLVPLDEEKEDNPRLIAPATAAAVAIDPRLQQATDEALAALSAEDGFVLACYFLDGQTLANIARTLHLHESTVSRRLEKVTTKLRKKIRATLLDRGMSRAQAEEALQADVRDLQINVCARVRETLQEGRAGTFSRQRISDSVPGGKPGGDDGENV
jgi:RNA polymerase sigma-70 factor (ECF subfamily)